MLNDRPMPWRIEFRESIHNFDDAYAVGPLSAIQQAAFDVDVDWVAVQAEPIGYRAFGGRSVDQNASGHIDTSQEDYWGNGATVEEALRWLYGAVLDPREGR